MLIRLKTILLSAIFVMAVFSCSKHEPFSYKGAEIVVSAGVLTRAGYEGTVTLPDNFVMDIIQNAGVQYDYKTVLMEKDKGRNTYSAVADIKMMWAVNAYTGVDVKAMTLPYGMETVDAANSMQIAVSENQSSESEILKSDLLAATKKTSEITVSEGNVKINFSHKLSKLEINYAFGEGLKASDVQIHTVALENVCVKGGYSYSEMAFDSAIDKVLGAISMYHDSSKNLFEAIFFPYVPSSNPRLIVNATILGQERVMTCPIVPKGTSGFVSGKRYTLNVTFTNNSVNVNSVGIESAWDDDTEDREFDTV